MSDTEQRPQPEDIPVEKLPYPAKQSDMRLPPQSDFANYRAADKLKGKVALITGADSGIGRAVAIAYALEGASWTSLPAARFFEELLTEAAEMPTRRTPTFTST